MFVDDGSSVDILYLDILEKMRISPQSLRVAVSPFHDFIGDSIFPEGSIELAVSFGEEPKRSTAISNFMEFKCRSSYNAIIGRPTLVAMKEVTSTYHLCLKFPTLCSITFVRENQYEARMCYTTSVRSAPVDSKGKRTTGGVDLAGDEAFIIEVPEIQYELDPRQSA